ncbi:uncharacterized protein LOC117572150 [Drosophila albomicans]|uniref:Uncharacterized protein LOC117572150 n=1 Tax=Drosophila albomicans TaxID=7291 RepID=A0A6P8XGP1_DROAB|nr:uncharacterized protein LOC117572150 [Drosophila albomicans]
MHTYKLLFLFTWTKLCVLGLNLQYDEFYSKSFVPNDIFVSYSVENMEELNYNMTVREQFPGKLLMHVFARRLDNVPGGSKTVEMIKMKNLDFCKTLESLRNLTLDDLQGESLMPSTFLMSCPLTPGFYYVDHGSIDVNLFPLRLEDGRYLVQFELIQVYDEVIKLLNCKIKLRKKKSEEPHKKEDLFSSEEKT